MIEHIAKYITISTLVFLTISCDNNREINGFYFGKNGNIPVLVNYTQDYYINYFEIPCDTLKYQRFGDEFQFKMNEYNLDYNRRIVQKDQKLYYYLPESDTLLYKLEKRKSLNYIFDLLEDKNMRIDLPNGNGKSETLGHEFRIHNPLYVKKEGKDVLVNFNNKTTSLDEHFYKDLITEQSEKTNHWIFPITLIADQNLPIKELINLEKQLKIAGYEKIFYMLSSQDYEKVKYFPSRIPSPSIDELKTLFPEDYDFPPVPPTLISKDLNTSNEKLVIQHFQNNWKFNNSPINQIDLIDQIVNKIKSNPDVSFTYSINHKSTYKEYIEVLNVINTCYLKQEKEYIITNTGSNSINIPDIIHKFLDTTTIQVTRLVEINSTDPKN